MRCVLVGNYGVGNMGDEALRDFFCTSFPEVAWTVVSARLMSGQEVPRLPLGFRSFGTTPWWRTIGAFFRTDAVVFGGGSLWTDVESSFACLLWAAHAGLAFLFRKPVFLAFQGIGPFHTKRGERLARFVLARATFVSVRDPESAARIASWKMNTSCILSSDPLFLYPPKEHSQHPQNVLIVIPRSLPTSTFLEALRSRVERGNSSAIRLLSLQPDDAAEQRSLAALASEYKASIVQIRSFAELLEELADASFVLTQRYHGAIAALVAGKALEICPQGQGDKLWALRERLARETIEHVLRECQRAAYKGEEALRLVLGA